jgi:hypothetical protein
MSEEKDRVSGEQARGDSAPILPQPVSAASPSKPTIPAAAYIAYVSLSETP